MQTATEMRDIAVAQQELSNEALRENTSYNIDKIQSGILDQIKARPFNTQYCYKFTTTSTPETVHAVIERLRVLGYVAARVPEARSLGTQTMSGVLPRAPEINIGWKK